MEIKPGKLPDMPKIIEKLKIPPLHILQLETLLRERIESLMDSQAKIVRWVFICPIKESIAEIMDKI